MKGGEGRELGEGGGEGREVGEGGGGRECFDASKISTSFVDP